MAQAVIRQLRQILRLLEVGEALEGADADVAVLEADQDGGAGRGGLVAALQRLAGLDQREALRGLDAERLEHLGRKHLADSALEGQPSVAEAAVGGLAGALGAEVEQPALLVAELSEQEAAAVADVRIVHPELVAVVAQRERLGEIVRKRLEAAEMADPLRVVEPAEADRAGRDVVAEPQDGLREAGRLDRIVEGLAELEYRPLGAVGRRTGGHCAQTLPPARGFRAAA